MSLSSSEESPLLLPSAGGGDVMSSRDDNARGQASFCETVINLMKTCMGTGFVALPFACKQGGLILNCVGLLAIALWNAVCVQRLCDCLNYIPEQAATRDGENGTALPEENPPLPSYRNDETKPEVNLETPATRRQPPSGASTFGLVAWYAFGDIGLDMVDAILFVFLLGVVVTFLVASVTFLSDTPFTCGPLIDVILAAVVVSSLCMVPDVGYLAMCSAAGLIILAGTFVILVGYGLVSYQHQEAAIQIPLFPESLAGACQWFGISVFGFGVVPLTYNFRDSMAQPTLMVKATSVAVLLVLLGYIVIGVGLLAAFPNLTGDVLHEIPRRGVLPIVTRLAMVWVVLFTAPLLGIPCAELLEGKLKSWFWQGEQASRRRDRYRRIIIRVGAIALSAAIAECFPGFVEVLSFVGCASVSTVSFVLPPLFHFKLTSDQPSARKSDECETFQPRQPWHQSSSAWADVFLFVWGATATIISTALAFQKANQ